MKIIERHLGQKRFQEVQANHALAAALVHDLGHGPFSHAFEAVGARLGFVAADHEVLSDKLIRDSEVSAAFTPLGSGFASDVASVIKTGGKSIYSAVVSSQFDADRLDYIRRDRLMTGTHHGEIDFEWLISNLEVGEVPYFVDGEKIDNVETFVLGPKAVYAAEAFVLGLFQLYPTVYFHKTTRGIEKIFTELMVRVFQFCIDGSFKKTGLPKNHPICRFARNPQSTENALALDDSVIYGSLCLLMESGDETIRDLSARVRDRKIYRSINIREKISEKIAERKNKGFLVDAACAFFSSIISDWISEKPDRSLRILTDITERAPYRQFQESKGPLNQIRINTGNGELVDLGDRSKVVRGIETFKLHRVYVAPDDEDATRFVQTAIEMGIGNAKRTKKGKRGSPGDSDHR